MVTKYMKILNTLSSKGNESFSPSQVGNLQVKKQQQMLMRMKGEKGTLIHSW
jgi:hypothetical protein